MNTPRRTLDLLRRAATRRAVTRLALVAGVAIAASTGTAASASADWLVQLQNQNTGRCLSVYGGHVEAEYDCGIAGNWLFHFWNDGSIQIGVGNTRFNEQCLDDSFAYGLRMLNCWPGSSPYSKYQSWYRIERGYSGVTYKNQATGRCVDESYAFGPRAYSCNGLSYQNFFEGIVAYL